MRKANLAKLLKEQNYPQVLHYTCQCCFNVMRVQRRSLTEKHCMWLLCLRNLNNGGLDYVHHNQVQNMSYELYNNSVSDYIILKHLKLITEHHQLPGYYKVSETGLAFLQNKITIVRSYYQIPNSQEFLNGSVRVGIFELLKNLKYNYVGKKSLTDVTSE